MVSIPCLNRRSGTNPQKDCEHGTVVVGLGVTPSGDTESIHTGRTTRKGIAHMAARHDRIHSERVRERIKTTTILERVQGHALGELEMTPSQLTAAFGLLDRTVPKLSQVQHVGDPDQPVELHHTVEFVNGARTASDEA
jgi:hypothetical protein